MIFLCLLSFADSTVLMCFKSYFSAKNSAHEVPVPTISFGWWNLSNSRLQSLQKSKWGHFLNEYPNLSLNSFFRLLELQKKNSLKTIWELGKYWLHSRLHRIEERLLFDTSWKSNSLVSSVGRVMSECHCAGFHCSSVSPGFRPITITSAFVDFFSRGKLNKKWWLFWSSVCSLV